MNCDNWVLTIRPKKQVAKEQIKQCRCITVERPIYSGYSPPPQAYYPYNAPPAQTYQTIPQNINYPNRSKNQSLEDEVTSRSTDSTFGSVKQGPVYANRGSSSSSMEYQPNGPVYVNRSGPMDSEPYQPKGPVHVYPESSIPKFLYGLKPFGPEIPPEERCYEQVMKCRCIIKERELYPPRPPPIIINPCDELDFNDPDLAFGSTETSSVYGPIRRPGYYPSSVDPIRSLGNQQRGYTTPLPSPQNAYSRTIDKRDRFKRDIDASKGKWKCYKLF